MSHQYTHQFNDWQDVVFNTDTMQAKVGFRDYVEPYYEIWTQEAGKKISSCEKIPLTKDEFARLGFAGCKRVREFENIGLLTAAFPLAPGVHVGMWEYWIRVKWSRYTIEF